MPPLTRAIFRPLVVTLPLALTVALLVSVPTSHAATSTAATERGPSVDRQEETGRIGFIGAPAGRPIDPGLPAGSSPTTVATTYLRQNAAGLGLAGSRTTLEVSGQHRNVVGGQTVRVEQVHAGIPVFGGAFTVNLDEDRDILSVLGEASPIGTVATDPLVGSRAARRAAIGKVAREAGVAPGRLAADEPELMLYDPRLLGAPGPFQTARLSWVTEVRSARPAVAHTVVVDAASGTVALSFSTIAHARDRVVCDADGTAAQYPCLTPVWTESSTPGGVDPDVAAAFDYAGDTYDFFFTRFGRDSLDDAGMQLTSTVDYCPAGEACPYQNAFWDGSQMVYGDGFAAADDVVGHELAHGVTDFSSSLFYYMQSGAINESMSDIFGELIDLTNDRGDDTSGVRWLLGEDIPVIGAIRDMENPPAFGQPDRMNSSLYFSGPDDSGGVHYNSGVSNKAASLLVDGGTFRERTIGPLGVAKTALLFYTVNNDLLVSGSDFADLANAMRQACTTLAGTATGGFTTADCGQVEQAVLATEMDLNPTRAPTDVVAPCPTGSPTYAHRDDLETPAGQFTTMTILGSEVWSYPQNPNDYIGYDATYATSGSRNIWGDNPAVTSDSALRMTSPVTIPADAYLHFHHAHGFENDLAGFYDGGVVEYSTSGPSGPWSDAGSLFTTGGGAGGYGGTISGDFLNPLGDRDAFVGESNGYGASRANLSALAGESVLFRWRIGTDELFDGYGWFIDDVSIVTCAAADTTPPQTTITRHPPKRTSLRKAKFTFRSSEPGGTFRCKLDGQRWRACTSPSRVKVTPGRHTFRVRAVDAAGNADPTPAVWRWRVKRG